MTPPPNALLVLWLLWVLQSAWACFNVRTYRLRAARFGRWSGRRLRKRGPFTPPAAVIVPVKRPGLHFADHVLALARQDYPAYRLIFVVESAHDPAFAALESLRVTMGREMEIVTAGRAERGGQKVHNQLAALHRLRPDDEAVVFADADAVPHNQWLKELVEPLRRNNAGATTGYRWLVPIPPLSPEPDDESPRNRDTSSSPLASSFASVINASVATLLGPLRRNHAWGGSMALMRTTLDEVRLREHWQGALSDDYQLSHAMTLAGKRIIFVPCCLVVSPADFTWPSLLEFGRRQYLITRIHAPLIWLAALLITALYTAGWISVLTASILTPALAASGFATWMTVIVFDLLRATLRRRAVVDLLGPDIARQLAPVWRLERFATPAWMALHLALVLASALGRRITWAGITYHIRSRQNVQILSRR